MQTADSNTFKEPKLDLTAVLYDKTEIAQVNAPVGRFGSWFVSQLMNHFSKKEMRPVLARRAFSMLSYVGVPRGRSKRSCSDAMIFSASPKGPTKPNINGMRHMDVVFYPNIRQSFFFFNPETFCGSNILWISSSASESQYVWAVLQSILPVRHLSKFICMNDQFGPFNYASNYLFILFY